MGKIQYQGVAEFNRKDISSKFNPTPGTNEIVTLNLSSGRNVIVLSMDGQLPKRVATDKDRLVIKIAKLKLNSNHYQR